LTQAAPRKILLIGYGNPAREDDGLGPAAASRIEKLEISGITVEADYQLTVEDAAAVARHDAVIFIDASTDGKEPFSFRRLPPRRQESFSSHSVAPESVLAMAKDFFNVETQGYMLGIRGYSFSMFKEEMTEKALENLAKAIDFLVSFLHSKSFHEAAE
jgi:hydrogenase maturation protease